MLGLAEQLATAHEGLMTQFLSFPDGVLRALRGIAEARDRSRQDLKVPHQEILAAAEDLFARHAALAAQLSIPAA